MLYPNCKEIDDKEKTEGRWIKIKTAEDLPSPCSKTQWYVARNHRCVKTTYDWNTFDLFDKRLKKINIGGRSLFQEYRIPGGAFGKPEGSRYIESFPVAYWSIPFIPNEHPKIPKYEYPSNTD